MGPNLEQLYSAWAADVRRFAFWLTGDTATAEDITSETFVRALSGFDRIRTESVKGYLFVIARNLAQAEAARRRHHHPLRDEHLDARASPAQRTEERHELDAVLKAAEDLPPAEREALALRAIEQLPYDEVARVLGISVVAAKVRVHRARAHLLARTGRTPGG